MSFQIHTRKNERTIGHLHITYRLVLLPAKYITTENLELRWKKPVMFAFLTGFYYLSSTQGKINIRML